MGMFDLNGAPKKTRNVVSVSLVSLVSCSVGSIYTPHARGYTFGPFQEDGKVPRKKCKWMDEDLCFEVYEQTL